MLLLHLLAYVEGQKDIGNGLDTLFSHNQKIKIMTQFKTLLERLKPEIKALMEADRELYPHTVSGLEKQLAKEFFVSDVRYGAALDIITYYSRIFGAEPKNLYVCFDSAE